MSNPKFMVCGLPRSRTAWLARFLAGPSGAFVGHDLATRVGTVDEFLGLLGPGPLAGVVETGAGLAWPLVAQAWPETRFLVVWRDSREVQQSLAKFGLGLEEADLFARLEAMADLEARLGTMSIDSWELDNRDTAKQVYEHCRGEVLPEGWWEELILQNIQVDMPATVARLAARADVAAALRHEVAERLAKPRPYVWMGLEPWNECADEIIALAHKHYAEAEDTTREFAPRREIFDLTAAAGLLWPITLRIDGELRGYCMWSKEIDTEAQGGIVMAQGAWYVGEGLGGLGFKLFRWPFDLFRRSGVTQLRLHHTLQGRGARLGAFFKRLGAEPTKHEYVLRLEAQPHG